MAYLWDGTRWERGGNPVPGGGGGGGDGSEEFPFKPQAASIFGWGAPNREDQFDVSPNTSGNWAVYNGPGHAGNGTRSPAAITVSGGIMTMIGNAAGQSGGMAWRYPGAPGSGGVGQFRGRWECAMKTAAGSVNYHPVLLLWNDAQQWPASEVDFCEILDTAARTRAYLFLHYANFPGGTLDPAGPDVDFIDIDCTQWHTWAVEWQPTFLACYCDGVEWARSTNLAKLPPSAMHMTIQLDNFSSSGSIAAGGRMDVAWARQYNP